MRNFFNSLLGRSATQQQLKVMPQGATVTVSRGQTLLEAALAQGIAFPHDCTVGTCASCKCKLREGRVREATPFGYTLSKQELDAGYILACQAVPRDPLTVLELEPPGADLPPPEHHDGVIVRTQPLTHDILKVTVRTEKPVHYVAGQYASITVPGLPRARHYSFADAPQREGRRELCFFIRRVPGGGFTEALFDGILQQQPLTIHAPHGHFYLRGGEAPMICIVGGSGLAPLLSVLEQARKSRLKRRCVLLFGARTQADLYMLGEINALARAWPALFNFVPVLSHEPASSDWTGARGWVTDFIASAADGISVAAADDWQAAEAYMCGPPPMIDAAIERLTELGLPLKSIHYDKFTDGRDATVETTTTP